MFAPFTMLFQDVNICTSALAASESINCDSEQKMFNEEFVVINLLKKTNLWTIVPGIEPAMWKF